MAGDGARRSVLLLLCACAGRDGAAAEEAAVYGANAIDGITGDPRMREGCRHFFAPFNLSIKEHPFDMAVVEDAIPRAALVPKVGLLFKPYGRALRTTIAGSGVTWVEVPKAGSTTFKRALNTFPEPTEKVVHMMRNGLGRRAARGQPAPAFAIVREPLARALSAYGTLRDRLKLICIDQVAQWPALRKRPDPWRVRARACPHWLHETNATAALAGYVHWLTRGMHVHVVASLGRIVTPRFGLELMHAFSQAFFLALYPWQLERVVRLEALEKGVRAFERTYGDLLSPDGSPRQSLERAQNVDQGGVAGTLQLRAKPAKGKGAASAKAVHSMKHGFWPWRATRALSEGSSGDVPAHAKRELLRELAHHYRQDYACLGYPYPPPDLLLTRL